MRIFLATPRLRALLTLELAVAAAAAMVTVNTVVIVQDRLGLGDRATAIGFALFGAGSVLGALLLPRLLQLRSNRVIMLSGGAILTASLAVATASSGVAVLGGLWFLLGLGCALAELPYGTLLRRSGASEARQSLYATHFALSNLCRLITYPAAGTLGAIVGIPGAFALLGLVAGLAVVAAAALWPSADAWKADMQPAGSDPQILVPEELR